MSRAVEAGEQALPRTTAAVFDYICLFTHDLRRKQKRWQDGKLRFHTFNKKFVVYDERGRVIGDGHWGEEVGEMGEGVEVELDRGGAIVRVEECTGRREQDLTEILDKRARRAGAAAREAATPRSAETSKVTREGGVKATKEAVSNAGPVGRAAIPQESPYEAKKKRRVEVEAPSKMGHAQSLFGTRLSLTAPSVPLKSWRNGGAPLLSTMERPVSTAESPLAARSKSARGDQLPETPRLDDDEEDVGKRPQKRIALASPHREKSKTSRQEKPVALAEHNPRPDRDKRAKRGETSAVIHPKDPVLHDQSLCKGAEETRKKRKTKEKHSIDESDQSVPLPKVKEAQAKEHITTNSNADGVSPAKEEKRTALRIKPRQKRGLLMLSEDLASVREPSPEPLPRVRDKLVEKRFTAREIAETSLEPTPEPSILHPVSDEDDDPVLVRSRRRETVIGEASEESQTDSPPKKRAASPCLWNVVDDEDDERVLTGSRRRKTVLEEEDSPPRKRAASASLGSRSSDESVQETSRRRGRFKVVHEPTSSESEERPSRTTKKRKTKKNEPGPRITKMARKSVKSKEILGLAVSVGDTIPKPFMSMVNALGTSFEGFPSVSIAGGPTLAIAEKGGEPQASETASSAGQRKERAAAAVAEKGRIPQRSEAVSSVEKKGTEPTPLMAENGRDVQTLETLSSAEKEEEEPAPAVPKKSGEPRASETVFSVERKGAEPTPVIAGIGGKPQAPEVISAKKREEKLTSAFAEKGGNPHASGAMFFVETKDDQPRPAITGRGGKPQPSATVSSAGKEDKEPTPGAESAGDARPKIVNPATRGKKAARKEDAAGQAPRCMVPFDPVIVKPRVIYTNTKVDASSGPHVDHSSSNRAGANASAGATGGPAVSKTLSGFVKANGGAWSRHADDLLGMDRPASRR